MVVGGIVVGQSMSRSPVDMPNWAHSPKVLREDNLEDTENKRIGGS